MSKLTRSITILIYAALTLIISVLVLCNVIPPFDSKWLTALVIYCIGCAWISNIQKADKDD